MRNSNIATAHVLVVCVVYFTVVTEISVKLNKRRTWRRADMSLSPSRAGRCSGVSSLHYKGTVLPGKQHMDNSMRPMRCELCCSLSALITKRWVRRIAFSG